MSRLEEIIRVYRRRSPKPDSPGYAIETIAFRVIGCVLLLVAIVSLRSGGGLGWAGVLLLLWFFAFVIRTAMNGPDSFMTPAWPASRSTADHEPLPPVPILRCIACSAPLELVDGRCAVCDATQLDVL